MTSYQFDYGPDSNGNPHYGFQGLAGSQPLNIVSQFWSEIDTGREPELPGWFASCPAIAGPIVQYAVLYGQGTARGQTVGEWQECPAGSDSPIWTITNPNGFDETLSDFGFLLSPFAIDLNLLNFNGVLPPDQSFSPLSPLSSLDGTILAAGQSVIASAAPEPTSLGILGVALAGFGFARRRKAL